MTTRRLAIADQITSPDQSLALEISGLLAWHYPGHKFLVHVNSHPTVGMAYIQHLSLSEKDGYQLKIGDLWGPNQIKQAAIKAGGEILERFNVRRGKADRDELQHHQRRAAFS